MRLFVLRHGETEWSRERRFTGGRDVGLTPAGKAQAEAAAVALAASPVHAVYTSPLVRAHTSAELIARSRYLPVRLDARFAEMGFGRWEGLTLEHAAAEAPALYAAWRTTPHTAAPPDGESLMSVAARVAEGIAVLQATHAGEAVVLVTHAIVVRLIVLAALGLDADRLWSIDASPGGLTEIEYRPGWVTVHRMNTLAHLERTPEGVWGSLAVGPPSS